jgi:PAS domain S-box-containing protein
MVNLAQLHDRGQILRVFGDAVNGLGFGVSARVVSEPDGTTSGLSVPIEHAGHRFGSLVLGGPVDDLHSEHLAALRNAAAILAVVLQNLEGAERLEMRHQLDRRALDEQEASFHELFQHITAGVALYRPTDDQRNFVIENLNASGLRLGDVAYDDAVGRLVTDVFPGIEATGLFEVLQRVSTTGISEVFGPSHYQDSRVDMWVENTVSRMPSGRVVAIFDDVTDVVRNRIELEASEARYRFLAENTSDVIWTLSDDLRFTYVSPSVERMRGYSPEEVMAMGLDEALTPRSFAKVIDRLTEVDALLADAQVMPTWITMELEQPCKDGSTVWTEAAIRRVVDTGSGLDCYVGVSRDIGDRRRAQEALRQSERRLELAIEGSRGGLWDMPLDPTSDTLPDAMYLSPRLKAILGYRDDELPGSLAAWMDHIVEEDVPKLLPAARASFRDGQELHEVEYRVRTRARDIRWIMSSGRVERDPEGRAMRWTGIAWDVTNRKLAEIAIRESEARYRRLFDDAVLGILRTSPDGRLLEVNRAFSRMFGYDSPETMVEEVTDVARDLYADPDERPAVIAKGLVGDGPYLGEVHYRRRDGSDLWCNLFGWPVENTADGSVDIEGFVEDVSNRRTLEEQLRQSQKLEAIGRLAGGVAHDFNNILQAILGSVEFARVHRADPEVLDRYLDGVRDGAEKATTLTRQLLAFSRRQVLQRSVVDIGGLVTDMLTMLRRIVGEHLELHFEPGPDITTILADRGQIEQVVMNLVVNARDAMPDGGTIRVSTRTRVADQVFCSDHRWAVPGTYAMLEVEDSGDGMSPDILDRVFEPFFTTKEMGRGTGLGLSTVYGIVEQHGGRIDVTSEVGRGSRFTVYLPASDRQPSPTLRPAEGLVEGGSETILLAEDEETVRSLAIEALEAAGYTVLAASDGRQAAELWNDHHNTIDVAILDVVMPGLGGLEVHGLVRRDAPDLPVVFSSGYSLDAISRDFTADPTTTLIEKPYSLANLLQTIRRMLDGTPPR